MKKQAIRGASCLRGLLCLGGCALLLLWNLAEGVPAAPQPNESCAWAQLIPGTGPFPHLTVIRDISSATTNGDPAAPSCITYDATNLTRSVWYSFRPAVSGRYLVSSCSDAPTATTVDDTVMAIYAAPNGCPGTSGSQVVEISGGR